MKNGRRYGKIAEKLPKEDCERYMADLVRSVESEVEAKNTKVKLLLQAKSVLEKEIISEIAQQGNYPRGAARSGFIRGILGFGFMSVPLSGEFVFFHWTLIPFQIGQIETILVAVAIVITTLKGFDIYLSAYRKHKPSHENRLFLVLASSVILSMLLLILFSAEIRLLLYEVKSNISNSNRLEDTVVYADKFHEATSNTFIYLMFSLTFAVTISSGIVYHLSKNQLLVSLPILRSYRKLRRTRKVMLRCGRKIARLDSVTSKFIADFKTGLHSEQIGNNDEGLHEAFGTSAITEKLTSILLFPITLIILAFIIFFLLRGRAFGDEIIIFLDLSRSVSVADYSGNETEFKKNIDGIEDIIRNRLSNGDNIYIAGITKNSFSRPNILLKGRTSEQKGAFGENMARQKLALIEKWQSMDLKPNATGTDIFGAASLASILFSDKGNEKYLVFFSDMRHCTKGFDIEKPSVIEVDKAFEKLKLYSPIPLLKGVDVWCLGVHGANKSPSYWMSLKTFWNKYFEAAKANTFNFSMERRFQR